VSSLHCVVLMSDIRHPPSLGGAKEETTMNKSQSSTLNQTLLGQTLAAFV